VVGELLAVEKHPRADRLSLTRVTIGEGEPLEIVCGATNIAVGQRVPVALPGAVLPGDRRIERTEKMGVVSNGMLCSGDELRLTGDGDGILILPPDAPLGVALADLYGDTVLDIDVKPNRGDALSIVGVAREVAAVTGGTVRWPETDVPEAGRPVSERLQVQVEDPELCPRFVGRWVSRIQIGPSPDAIQMRLLAAGQRPVSNVVDASEVSEGTTDVVIESAVFDPVSIRRTAFRFGLRSEASLRFEKGQEHRLARIGADRTARLIHDWAGGEVAPGRVDTNPAEPEPTRVAFRPARVARLLGVE